MTTYDSVSFDLRLASGTIMNVLIVLIVRHPVQLTIVSHIRKYISIAPNPVMEITTGKG